MTRTYFPIANGTGAATRTALNNSLAELDTAKQEVKAAALTPGANISADFNAASVFTLTPGQTGNINATGGLAGQRASIIITTSGTSSYTLTFNTNFKTAGPLATGTSSGKVFCISFVCKDGTTWVETGRTAAM